MGKQGAGTFTELDTVDVFRRRTIAGFQDGRDLHQRRPAVTGLQFYADLVLKDKVVPPEAMTWEFDEIIAGGAEGPIRDVAVTFSPYGTLIQRSELSKTAGRWAWATMPGHTEKAQSRTIVDGQFMAISKYSRNADWAIGIPAHGV